MTLLDMAEASGSRMMHKVAHEDCLRCHIDYLVRVARAAEAASELLNGVNLRELEDALVGRVRRNGDSGG